MDVCVSVTECYCALVCKYVQYVLCSHLTRFESDVGGGKRHTELVGSELETFIKRKQQALNLASSWTSFIYFFYPALSLWFLAVLIETDKAMHGSTQWPFFSLIYVQMHIYANLYRKMYLRPGCWPWLHKYCVLNHVELLSAQLFTRLETQAAWLGYVTFALQHL